MEVLNGKNYFLQQYLQGQQAKLIEVGDNSHLLILTLVDHFFTPPQDLVPTIDDYRQRIQKINERRDLLVTHMERMDDTNKHNHEILEDLEHSVRFLRQLNRDADIAASVISDADEVMEEWFEENRWTWIGVSLLLYIFHIKRILYLSKSSSRRSQGFRSVVVIVTRLKRR